MLQYILCATPNDLQGARGLRLVHIGLRFDFVEEKHVPPLAQKVFEAITGKTASEPEHAEGTVIRSNKRKMEVMWNPTGCRVAFEDMPNLDKWIETSLRTLEQINKAVPIGKLNERWVTMYWILPVPNYNFPSLEQKYRETMITQNEISSLASDSSVVFDIRMGEWTLHHQSGAMWPEQLYDYIRFKVDDILEAFLFLETSIVEEKVIEYSEGEIRNHLAKALDCCKSHSDVFHRIWEEIL